MVTSDHATRVSVLIPALNEEDAIAAVIEEIPRPPVTDILVVDNGSADRTADVAREHGACVVREERRGYGQACRRGLAEIGETDVVVFLDGDHSDHPEELPGLIAPILAGQADLVIGSRALGEREAGALTPQQVYGNRLACFLIGLLCGHHYTDLGPFRAIRWTALQRLDLEDANYGWTVEMQIKAVRQGFRVMEVPVRYRRRIGQSKISGTWTGAVKAGFKIIATILRYAWP
jgi:glycosyltransferase involved in cell wall biosynthesis